MAHPSAYQKQACVNLGQAPRSQPELASLGPPALMT